MRKHGVSRKWFTETNVKHFKTGALRAITNIAEEYILHGKVKKRIPLQVCTKSTFHRHRAVY